MEFKKELKNLFFGFVSRKLLMTVFAVAVLWFAYWKQVDYLYTFGAYQNELAQQLITAYVSITRDFMVALTGAVMAYLGVQGFLQWRHGTESIVNEVANFTSQNIKETREEKIIHQNTKEEDYKLE